GPGARGLTLDRGDGTGGGERASLCATGEQWAQADAQARRAERRRRRDVGLRDPLSIGAALRQPQVARIERSEIRDATCEVACGDQNPDVALLNPGYR